MKKIIKAIWETLFSLEFIEEFILSLYLVFIFGANVWIFIYIMGEELLGIISVIIYVIILFIFSAVIDMFMILKRLGVREYTFEKRDKWYKEFYYLLKYGARLWEGQIGSIDGEAAYTRKRYTSLFYDRYLIDEDINGGDNWLMVKKKKARVYSKSFIMKNNIPNKLTDKKICETWREPGTDIIYYGTLTIMNIVFYGWYFLIR